MSLNQFKLLSLADKINAQESSQPIVEADEKKEDKTPKKRRLNK